jgi:hypothetical protein
MQVPLESGRDTRTPAAAGVITQVDGCSGSTVFRVVQVPSVYVATSSTPHGDVSHAHGLQVSGICVGDPAVPPSQTRTGKSEGHATVSSLPS